MNLNYDNLSKTLEFLRGEIRDFELCLSYEALVIQNDERHYLNRLIDSCKIAIQVLEERLMCEIMCGSVEDD